MNRCLCVVVSLVLIVAVAACDANGTESSVTTTSTTGAATTTSTSQASTAETPATTSTTSTTPPVATTTSTTTTTTTTVPPDVTPPELVVTAPEPGETVTTRTYLFAGTTDPGCTVTAAGRYGADVDADGNWSIILVLNPGSNLATFTATDPAGNATTDQLRVDYDPPLVLRADGLGAVSFGDPVEPAMATLTTILGPPDWSEIQISADTDLSVRWDVSGSLYLQFTFDHWGIFDDDGGPIFNYYSVSSPLVATERGLTTGSTIDDLEATLPNVRYVGPYDMCGAPGWEFVIDHPSGNQLYTITGRLDGDPTDPNTRILGFSAGYDRTPC